MTFIPNNYYVILDTVEIFRLSLLIDHVTRLSSTVHHTTSPHGLLREAVVEEDAGEGMREEE